MKKYLLVALVLVYLAMASCGGESKGDAVAPINSQDSTTSELAAAKSSVSDSVGAEGTASTTISFLGTYKGTTPCADCEGILTTVELDTPNKYVFTAQEKGDGDSNIFTKTGSWRWKTGNVIELLGLPDRPSAFFLGENTLTQLDMSGKWVTGALADRYILKTQ